MPRPLEDIQDELLDRVHAGEPISREDVLAEHPEHTDALRRFFALLDEIERPPELAQPTTMRLGEFRIVREIGRGGMGVVHAAEQTSLKRRVALKVLPAVLATNRRIVDRFRREAEAAGRLRHPNIVPVYAVGDAGGVPFFAMELVEGRSLADLLAERAEGGDHGPPEPGEPWRRWVVATIASIAEALDYAHGQGILHRDVKPGNIMLEQDGTPRLTDFGLALDLDAPGLTRSGETFGTPLYMSPEQAIRREAPLDRRTDVYSLGVTLYETLTLRSPYAGTTTVEILAALQSGKIVAPRAVDPEMPRALEAVLLRALARDPPQRYETAAAFAADLRALLDDRRVSVPPMRPLGRRRPLLLAGVTLLAVASAWAFVALLSDPSDSTDPADLGTPKAAADQPAPAVSADADWMAIAAGAPGHDDLLAQSIRPSVRMREVVSRADPGAISWEVKFAGGEASYRADVVFFCEWLVQVDGGDWRVVRWVTHADGPSGEGSFASGIGLDDVLGDTLSNGSVGVSIRLQARVVTRPERMARFAGGINDAARPRDWPETGGSVFTWETHRTALIYDDFPADYPKVIRNAALDAEMRRSLTLEEVGGLSIGGSRRLSLDFYGIPPFGPLPAACEVDLCRAESDEVIGTATWTRDAAPPEAGAGVGAMDCSAGISFWLRDPPSPGEQRFVLDVASNSVPQVRLIFRPARNVALQETDFDRYWGGTVDVTLPVDSYAPAGEDGPPVFEIPGDMPIGVSGGGPPVDRLRVGGPGSEPWPDPTSLTTTDFEALVRGDHPDGEALLESWVHARARMPSVLTRDHMTRSFTPLSVMHGRIVPGPGEARGASLRAAWEVSVDGGPWQDLGTTESRMLDDDPYVFTDREDVTNRLGEAAVRDQVGLRFRVQTWLVQGPDRSGGNPLPTPEDWEAIADSGTRCTLEWSHTLRILERYPAAYPRALDDAGTRAAVRRWLDPEYVELTHDLSYLERFGNLALTLKIVGEVPVPIAAELDVFDPVTNRQIGRAQPLVIAPDTRRGWPWLVHFRVEVGDPAGEPDLQLARDLESGKKSSLRLVFRGTRRAALDSGDFVSDAYWAGELDLTVPFKRD